MIKAKIITIGKCKEAWLEEALAEYEKRLTNRLSIEWQLVKELSLPAEPFIALHPEGTHLDSPEWSRKFASFGARLTFVIGGAEGIPPHILQKASFQWSLSKLTFTHQITRLLLLEQLYRALEIQKGSGYHK